jgi:cilia- and flagella-associated protein 69
VLSLRRPFERVLKEGYKLDDKCLRNELSILINYVVTSTASHKFFLERETPSDSTFLEALLYYSTHDELNSKINFVGDGASTNKSLKPLFTTRDEDVEFKKLLWTCVLYLVRDPDNIEAHNCVIEKNFMQALLMYIDPNNSSLSTHRWQPP